MAKAKRWMAVADNHGDMQDGRAVKAALAFAKFWKPDRNIYAQQGVGHNEQCGIQARTYDGLSVRLRLCAALRSSI